MPLTRWYAIAVVAVALVAVACGDDDNQTSTGAAGRGETRAVEVDMVDIAFEPKTLSVDPDETVRFEFTNRGEVVHDAFIGDRDAQADHEAEMRVGGGDEHGAHGEDQDNAITVEPGETRELTYTFADSGTVEIGCHQPGHYGAGMKITVEVA